MFSRIRKRIWGDGEGVGLKGTPPPSEPAEVRPSSSASDVSGVGLTPTPATTTPLKGTKVERRASGASRFLKSLRSAGKESKEATQVSFIGLKDLDVDHSLSPEGKRNNPGYNSTAHRRPLEITRSQSFQEKRLLVVTNKALISPDPNAVSPSPSVKITEGLITPLKVKHSRAQSFVCNSNQSYILRQQKYHIHQEQNIYATPKSTQLPQNVNGLPPAPSPPSQTPQKKIETIYENLEAILDQKEEKRGTPHMTSRMTVAMSIQHQPLKTPTVSNGRRQQNLNAADYVNINVVAQHQHQAQRSDAKTGKENEDNDSGNANKKLRRSISEVPSERMVFPKKRVIEASSKAVYSSIGNGLSIWNLENNPSKSSSALSKSGTLYGIYARTGNQVSSPTVYSTLPRKGSEDQRSNNLNKNVPGSPPPFVSTLPLSPARSTPNLGSNKLQFPQRLPSASTAHPPSHPVYREPPIYTSVNSLGRVRSPNFRSKSSENVKLLNDTCDSIPRKLSTTSTTSNSSNSSGSGNKSRSTSTSSESSLLKMSKGLEPGSTAASWIDYSASTPVRDSSSLKGIRYGPGHEKYPSWPIPAASAADVAPTSAVPPASSRSKSWTEQTDYPKEKIVPYARPYMKKINPAYTQQLKTVMEKCERYNSSEKKLLTGPRGYASHSHLLPPPLGYRDMYNRNGTNPPSPPERDSDVQSLTQEDVEMYSKKYEELMSHYAQSEGYHSYISSECSSSSSTTTTTTPFLDLLRRESGELNQQFNFPDMDPSDPLFLLQGPPGGRESVTTVVTNSSSNSNSSGTETLKCYGSSSDISLASTTTSATITQSSKAPMLPQKLLPERKGWNPPTSDMSSREINLKKFPLSTYTRPTTLSVQGEKVAEKGANAGNKCQGQAQTQPSSSPIIDTSKPPSVAERIWELEKKQGTTIVHPSPPKDPVKPVSTTTSTITTTTTTNPTTSPKPQPKITQSETLPLTSSLIQSIKSGGGTVSFSLENEGKGGTPSSEPSNFGWNGKSDAEESISYSYLDPEKKHKVADMTLKAIQKKALLSYYERHAAKTEASSQSVNLREGGPQEPLHAHSRTSSNSCNGNTYPTQDKDETSERLGSISKFSSGQLSGLDQVGGWNKPEGLDGPSPVSSGDQTQSLLPPERPPKKPHLRQFNPQNEDDKEPPPPLPRAPVRPPQSGLAHGNLAPPLPSKLVKGVPHAARSPSPELPPPPPPIVEEETGLLVNDDPLPPPPTEAHIPNPDSLQMGTRSRSATTMSSYLHKDSYLAQKERTANTGLGYEGRYRRTLSPSGLGTHGSAQVPAVSNPNPTSTGKVDTSLTPTAWEKYHNIRPPSTTVIFSSQELPNPSSHFHRSISCDSNLFNNKTGFTHSTIPPPVAQVAPIRDPYNYHIDNHQSKSSLELEKAVEPFHHSSSSASSSSSLTFSQSPVGGSDLTLNLNDYGHSDRSAVPNTNGKLVMVSPLQYKYQEEKGGSSGGSSPALKKSELSLRVTSLNAVTSDMGSQTEVKRKEGEEKPSPRMKKDSNTSSTSTTSNSTSISSCSSSLDEGSKPLICYTGRQKQKSLEELECEELSRHLIQKLPMGDRLQQILVPSPEHKTTADYMEGLFHLELKLKSEKETNTTPSPRESPDLIQSLPKGEGAGGKNPQTPSSSPQPKGKNLNEDCDTDKICNGQAPLPADSPYFTTSECKAKFLTQYVKDMTERTSPITKSQDSQELNLQKEMLVSRIGRKLEILRTEQLEIREEIESNEQLGQQVAERVKQSAKRNEFDKFKLHVEEIEKITSLLLGLSGRLARAENALMSLLENSNPQDKKILESKRDRLREQLDEAKVLKENIDRRSAQVSVFLQKYLTTDCYADYHHFVKMKAKLIIDAREIDDKIKLGEEQMAALKDTLNSS